MAAHLFCPFAVPFFSPLSIPVYDCFFCPSIRVWGHNRLTELRIERRQKLTEDEDDQLLATLKDLNGILDEYEPTVEFDNGLFDEIVESITVDSSEQLTFKLIGGITLTEQIPKKGR